MPTPTAPTAVTNPPVFLADAGATEAAGRRLAVALAGGMMITLSGELGAGKTTLVRGALRGLGWTGPIKSPTYVLVEHYPFSRLYFYHFDFYRFKDPVEWETAGLTDYFRRDSVCVIEWPERVRGFLPPPDLELSLDYPAGPGAGGRWLNLAPHSEAGERCANAITRTGVEPA